MIIKRSIFYCVFGCKFLDLPVFAFFQRYEIVNGVVEVDGVSDEPTSENASDGKESDGMGLDISPCIVSILNTIFMFAHFSAKGVPDFWLTAMKTNEILAEEVILCLPFFLLGFSFRYCCIDDYISA